MTTHPSSAESAAIPTPSSHERARRHGPTLSTQARALYLLPLSLAIAAALVGCGGGQNAAAAGGPGAMPPPPVGVIKVQAQSVALQTELPGRVEALRTAQVRARVNGIVLKRLFTEGALVKEGQPLFQIDPAPYQAALESAEAQLAKARANLTQAQAQAERNKPLADAKAISQQDYVNSVAAAKGAEADVAAAKAAVVTAKLNLDYASVRAPISGRIGRALVTEGALVSAAEATQLALVQQVDKVYVNFTQSANEVQALRAKLASGQLRAAGKDGQAAQVRVVLDDGSEAAQTGKLLFTDLSVDPSSGQVQLRAELPNEKGQVLPGQYVRVRLSQGELPSGFLLPQQSVKRGAQGDTVLLVGEGNKPEPRMVKLGGSQGNHWLVLDGLKPGDQVIVDGFQKMFVPGAPVQPVPWSPNAASAPAGASAAGH